MRSTLRLFIAVACAWSIAACDRGDEYDVILRGGTVVDGSGRAPVVADVGMFGGAVAAVGDLSDFDAGEILDVAGLVVAPGFINLHSHDRVARAPASENLLLQGVTTIILNADGGGPLDLAAQLAELEGAGLGVNIGSHIGFNSAWVEVNGNAETAPTDQQLGWISELLRQGLEDGAWGISAGLDYKPAYFASSDDVVSALSGLSEWRTLFSNHDRLTPESGYSSMTGMLETIEIAEAAGLMPVITHMKIQGHEQGTAPQVHAMMEAARARGVPVAADAYPYLAGQTSLAALIIPGWAQAGGAEAMLERFSDPGLRARIVVEADGALDARFGGASGVFLPESQRELTEVMAELGAASGGEAVVRILEEAGESPRAILRFGSEEDLAAILRDPATSIACDCDPADGPSGHPRYYGTFPRLFGRYVRELGVLSLEEAVRKSSALPATTIGMGDRGYIASGMAADLVVFDPEAIVDHATYLDPAAAPEGVVHVFVNGVSAVREGTPTGATAGRALRRDRSMPARAMEGSDSRRVRLYGDVASSQGAAEVALSLNQVARARGADGEFSVTLPDGTVDVIGDEFGELQTMPGWASFTAMGRVGSAAEIAPLHVVVDETTESGRTEVSVFVAGQLHSRLVVDALPDVN